MRAAVIPNRQFHIDYTVEISNTESNLFHVTAKVENIRQARLDLSPNMVMRSRPFAGSPVQTLQSLHPGFGMRGEADPSA